MAYNGDNHLKKVEEIIAVYQEVKEYDIPDTFVVKKLFPKRGIYISYRTWHNIKSKYLTLINAPLPATA